MDAYFAGQGLQLRHPLPLWRFTPELLVVVLHPNHGYASFTSSANCKRYVPDDSVALPSLSDYSHLDVDYEQS